MPPASPKYEHIDTPKDTDVQKDAAASAPRSKLAEWFFGVPGIIAGAILGSIIGYFVQSASPSKVVVSWIGVPGDLFIRAIKCCVLPLVFSSLVVGMADMIAVGKAGKIGWQTFWLYMITTLMASVEGLIAVLIVRPLFSNKAKTATSTVPELAMQCATPGYFLSHANGTVSCAYDAIYNSTSKFSPSSVFTVTDINSVFAKANAGFTKLTLSESLQAQLQTMVPGNITMAFADGTLLSIIMFALPFGAAVAILPREMKLVGDFFREVNIVFMTLIGWIILVTPVAIVSLLATSIAGQDDLSYLVKDVGVFVLSNVVTIGIHCYAVYPIIFWMFIRKNPFTWLRQMAKAQIFALSCASSMATLPITMECVEKTKEVSETVYRFVLSLGATINMDGSAIGYPIAMVFMAEAEGLGHLVGGVEMFLIVLVSTLGAIGSAPVPAAGIVMTMTIWQSVFTGQPLPSTFAFIVATDWFTDRFITALNVTGDTIVTRIVAEYCDDKPLTMAERESLDVAAQSVASHNPELREVIHSNNARV
jgi:Na+/H+-dicarboxylate symporter